MPAFAHLKLNKNKKRLILFCTIHWLKKEWEKNPFLCMILYRKRIFLIVLDSDIKQSQNIWWSLQTTMSYMVVPINCVEQCWKSQVRPRPNANFWGLSLIPLALKFSGRPLKASAVQWWVRSCPQNSFPPVIPGVFLKSVVILNPHTAETTPEEDRIVRKMAGRLQPMPVREV